MQAQQDLAGLVTPKLAAGDQGSSRVYLSSVKGVQDAGQWLAQQL